MHRALLALLTCLLLALPACRQSSSNPPEEGAAPSDPATDVDPLEGEPADIEGDEIGEDQLDDAKVVEPGPAESEVQKGNSETWPDPS